MLWLSYIDPASLAAGVAIAVAAAQADDAARYRTGRDAEEARGAWEPADPQAWSVDAQPLEP